MLFLIAFLIIWTLAPGPVVALTLNRARQFGYRTGIAVAAGATVTTTLIAVAGIGVHQFGLQMVDTASMSMTNLVGGTLIILLGMHAGYKAYLSAQESAVTVKADNQNRRSFIHGMMILTASIPQSIIFYVILVPQTIEPTNLLPAMIGLGVAKITLTFVWHSGVAVAADRSQQWLQNPTLNRRFDFATAIMMVAFGINILI